MARPTTVLLTEEQRAAIERVREDLKEQVVEPTLGDAIRLVVARGLTACASTPNTSMPRSAARR